VVIGIALMRGVIAWPMIVNGPIGSAAEV